MVSVAISGLHGTGKTTAAKALADIFDLRYVSAGSVFREMAKEKDMDLKEFSRYVEKNPELDRELDERTAEESREDDVLIDARLAGWMAEGADFRILLTAPLEVRVKRISRREDRPFDEVMDETVSRERSEKERFKDLYDIDVDDYSVFDLVLNTGKFNKDGMIEILERAVELI
ncbi:MAG: (d)CMP kinase [Candidatus Hadarchaeota archaeon]